MLHNIGAAVTSLLLTITVAAAVQGSYMCSLRGDCSWAILHNTGMGPISLLRLLRVFRIMWILKHVRFMRISTLLGALAVRAHMARGAFGGVAGWQQLLVSKHRLHCAKVVAHQLHAQISTAGRRGSMCAHGARGAWRREGRLAAAAGMKTASASKHRDAYHTLT
jgi:hypothetical protein